MQINAISETVSISLKDLALIQAQLNRIHKIANGFPRENKMITDEDIQLDALHIIRETLKLDSGPEIITRQS